MATFPVPGAKFQVFAARFPQIRAFWDVNAICLDLHFARFGRVVAFGGSLRLPCSIRCSRGHEGRNDMGHIN